MVEAKAHEAYFYCVVYNSEEDEEEIYEKPEQPKLKMPITSAKIYHK